MSDQTEQENKRASGQSEARTFFLKLAIVCGIVVVLFIFVFGVSRISGNGMYPSVRDGDLCFFFKLEPYHVGDVVAYKGADGKTHLGRIEVMAGGTFDISKNEEPLLNGSVISEEVVYPTPRAKKEYPLPCKVGEGEYWILNDFRSDTTDSRELGPISQKQLRGKVMFLFRRRSF